MACLLVTYDISDNQKREELLKAIKSYDHRMLTRSSYAIATTESPEDVYNKLPSCSTLEDCAVVLTITKPSFGNMTDDVYRWLTNNI